MLIRLYRCKLKKSRIFIYRDKWEEFMQLQCNYHIHFGTAVFPKLMIDRTHFHQTYCVKYLLWMRLLFPMNCGQNLHRQSITLMEYGQISEWIRTHKTVTTWQRAQTPKSHFSQSWRLLYLVCSKRRQHFTNVDFPISTHICIACIVLSTKIQAIQLRPKLISCVPKSDWPFHFRR